MKARILSMALVICMLFSLIAVMPASAENVTTVTSEGTTTINYLNYANGYNSNTGETGAGVMNVDGAASMVYRVGDWAEYILDVEEAGYYSLAMYTTVGNLHFHTWKAYVDGVDQGDMFTWYSSWNDIVGDVYLPAGRHTLKLENKAGWWRYLLGLTLTKKHVQSKSTWFAAQFPSASSGTRVEGNKLVMPDTSWAEFKVTVPEAGQYKLSAQHYYNYAGAYAMVSANNGSAVKSLNYNKAYVGDTTRGSDYVISPLAYIDLNAGENTIKLTHSGNSPIIYSFIIEKCEGFALLGTAATATTGSPRTEGACLVLTPDTTASFDVTVAEDGYYDVSVLSGSSANSRGFYNVSVDGELKATAGTTFQDWRAAKSDSLCTVFLKAGTRRITFRPTRSTSGHYFNSVLLEKVSYTATNEKATVIEDEVENVISAKNTISSESKKIYKINVLRDGVYSLSMKYTSSTQRRIANVSLDGSAAGAVRLQKSVADNMIKTEMTDLTLTKGIHEIAITNACSEEGFDTDLYVEELYLEKSSRNEEAIYVWAVDYDSIDDVVMKEDELKTNIEGPGMAFRTNDSLTYSVYIPKAGVYRLDVKAGNDTLNYIIEVDGVNAAEICNVIPKRSSSAVENQTMQAITDVWFEEAGVHTIKFTNNGGGAHYFSKFRLTDLAGDMDTSIITLASAYIEAYDAATSSTTAGVEGGNVTFANGDMLKYDASVYDGSEGWYNVVMVASRDTFNKSDITIAVNDEPAKTVGRVVGSGNWNVLSETVIGTVYLPAGANTITLRQTTGGGYYFYALILEKVELDEKTVVSGKESYINLQPMLGNQEGGEPMIAGHMPAVRIFGEKTVSYDLDVLEAGKYNVYVTTSKDHMIADTVYFDVAVGSQVSKAAITNPHGATYPLVNAGTFDFAEGEQAVSFTAAQDFALGTVLIEKVSDVEICLDKIDGENTISINALREGDYVANVNFNNGAYEGEEMIITFAIYERDSNGVKKLYKVVSKNVTADADGVELSLEDISFRDGYTYTTRCFAWEKATLYGESKAF